MGFDGMMEKLVNKENTERTQSLIDRVTQNWTDGKRVLCMHGLIEKGGNWGILNEWAAD